MYIGSWFYHYWVKQFTDRCLPAKILLIIQCIHLSSQFTFYYEEFKKDMTICPLFIWYFIDIDRQTCHLHPRHTHIETPKTRSVPFSHLEHHQEYHPPIPGLHRFIGLWICLFHWKSMSWVCLNTMLRCRGWGTWLHVWHWTLLFTWILAFIVS